MLNLDDGMSELIESDDEHGVCSAMTSDGVEVSFEMEEDPERFICTIVIDPAGAEHYCEIAVSSLLPRSKIFRICCLLHKWIWAHSACELNELDKEWCEIILETEVISVTRPPM